MTLRTITSPYDLQTLAEIEAQVAIYVGKGSWSNLSSNLQTVYLRIIDASADYILKRFRGEPWCFIEESLSLASGTATLSLSSAARSVDTIIEVYGGQTRVVTPATKRDYFRAWGTGGTTHPWNSQTDPKWLLDGMTSDNPPKLQLLRVPTPDAAVTGTALCLPYLTLLTGSGDASYTHIPATAATAMMDYVFEKVEKFNRNFDSARIHKASLEDEIGVTINADVNEGGFSDTGRTSEPPDRFYSELSG